MEKPTKPRLLDRVRREIRARNYSRSTQKSYVSWIRRFILFHGKKHPAEMGKVEITQFLTSLANERNVSASTQNQAFAALLFLYRCVLEQDVGMLQDVVRAKQPLRLPVVISRREVDAILGELRGAVCLMASLMYGYGLRLMECCRLRVKDVDLVRREITVRDGKGRKDRMTVIPQCLVKPLEAHLRKVRRQHEQDVRRDAGYVELPYALARKYPTPPANGPGNGSSPPPAPTSTPRPGTAAATTSTSPSSSAPSRRPYASPASPSP
jgi:site-specific recombinase XerD